MGKNLLKIMKDLINIIGDESTIPEYSLFIYHVFFFSIFFNIYFYKATCYHILYKIYITKTVKPL